MTPGTLNLSSYEARVQRLIHCYENRECDVFQFDNPGWLTPRQACLLNCPGRTADSTAVEHGVFAGLSTLYIAQGLRNAGRGVNLLSHDVFPTTVCEDQPYCWNCNNETCTLEILGDSPYSMPREKFDEDRRHLMHKYGSFEKWVLAKLKHYGLMDQVLVISSNILVPGEFKYLWLDTTHSCKEIEMNKQAILDRAAPDAVFLVHDMKPDTTLSCFMSAVNRKQVRLWADSLAVL